MAGLAAARREVRRRIAERSRGLAASGGELPPGPRWHPVFQLLAWWSRPVAMLEHCRRRFGSTFTLHLPAIGPVVLFGDPDAIRDIFTGSPDDLYAGEANAILEPMLGRHSLLLMDGDRHRRERRLLLPPFHGERMHAYGEVMRRVTEASLARWPRGEPFPVHARTQQITLEVILRTVFGMDEAERVATLRDKLTDLLELASDPRFLIPLFQVDLGKRSRFGRLAALGYEVNVMLYDLIVERKARGGEGRDDVLAMLVEARDEDGHPLGVEHLRDELMTLLLAGHETTATGLAWCFHHLLAHPGHATAVREELDRVMGDGPIDPARVGELRLLDGFVRETMRLNPIIPLVGRRLQRPLTLGGRHLPAGVSASPCIYLTHRNPEARPDPTRFDPGRFVGTKVSPYAFLPFGGGIRRCLGMAFALYEMRVVMATVLSHLDVHAVPGHRTRLVRRSITFAPSEGMPVVVTDRRRAG